MTRTSEQIKQLPDPYKKLATGDKLIKNQKELDKLSPEDMNELVTKIMLACPQAELNDYGHAIKAIHGSNFHTVLYQAYEVTQRMHALLNPDHPTPHSFFIGKEFNADLFNEFEGLSSKLVQGNETAIAARLALMTPDEHRSKLSRNIRNIFPESELAAKIGAAFTLRREIDVLRGDKPEDFFTSREFNIDLCNEFSMLFAPLLKGKEQTIGEKLSTQDHSVRHKICRHFETINCQAHDKENPFKLIAAAMVPKVEEEKTPVIPQEINSESLTTSSNNRYSFSNELRAQKEKATTISASEEDSASDYDEEKGSSCISSLCGLLGK